MTASDVARPEPVLVPGELRAYRLWIFARDSSERPRLRSYSYGGNHLRPGVDRYTATCMRSAAHFRYPLRGHPVGDDTDEELPVPARDCTCGFYGVVTGGLYQAYQLTSGTAAGTTSPIHIAGSVLMSGRVILGDRGVVRAEHMRLEAVFGLAPELLTGLGYNLSLASKMYGVPAFSDPHTFEERFPQQDLSALWPDAPVAADPTQVKTAVGTFTSADKLSEIKEEMHKLNTNLDRCACGGCQWVEQLMKMDDARFYGGY